jgi:hypothetical protein
MGYSLLHSYGRHWRMRGNADSTLVTYLNSLGLFVRDVLGGDQSALLDADRDLLERYVERRMADVSAPRVPRT